MKLKIEILTAVNIGSGDVFSQFSDYVYDDGFVYYLDHDRLLHELATKPNCDEMIDQFVMIVQNQAKGNTQDRFKLKSFLEGNGLDYKKYTLRKIPVTEEIKELLAEMVKKNPKAKDKMMNAITNQLWADFNENFAKNNIPRKEDISDN